jgi:hypothetical protein
MHAAQNCAAVLGMTARMNAKALVSWRRAYHARAMMQNQTKGRSGMPAFCLNDIQEREMDSVSIDGCRSLTLLFQNASALKRYGETGTSHVWFAHGT